MADDLGVKVNIDLGSTKTFEAKIKQYTPKNKIKVDIDIDQKTLNKLNEYAKAVKQINNVWSGGSNSSSSGITASSKALKDYSNQVLAIQRKVKTLQSTNESVFLNSSSVKTALANFDVMSQQFDNAQKSGQNLKTAFDGLRNSYLDLYAEIQKVNRGAVNDNKFESVRKGINSLNVEIANYLNNNKRVAASTLGRAMENELSTLTSNSTNTDLNRVRARLYELQLQAKQLGLESETAGQKLRKLFNEHMNTAIAMAGIHALQQAFVQLWQAIQDVDAAMTELKKVTNETEVTYDRFLSNAAVRAKNIGSSLSDVISSTADFARLGYGLDEATSLADSANIYKNVGD